MYIYIDLDQVVLHFMDELPNEINWGVYYSVAIRTNSEIGLSFS